MSCIYHSSCIQDHGVHQKTLTILVWTSVWIKINPFMNIKMALLSTMRLQRKHLFWIWFHLCQIWQIHCLSEQMLVKSLSHVQLFGTPWTVVHQASLSTEFSRQEYWERVAISFSRGSSRPRDQTKASSIAGRFFTIWATREALSESKEVLKCQSIHHQMLTYLQRFNNISSVQNFILCQ